jgi:hypothetical protein
MIMLNGVGVDPLPNYKREAAARWDAYVYVPDPDALAADSAMNWKETIKRSATEFSPNRPPRDRLARAIVSRDDYSKPLKRQNVPDKEGN